MVSGDTYALHRVLTNTEEGREVLESAVTIVYIHTRTLKKEFRGKGIGLKTMKFVVDQFAGGLNLILLHPAPLGLCVGEEGRDIAIKKIPSRPGRRTRCLRLQTSTPPGCGSASSSRKTPRRERERSGTSRSGSGCSAPAERPGIPPAVFSCSLSLAPGGARTPLR